MAGKHLWFVICVAVMVGSGARAVSVRDAAVDGNTTVGEVATRPRPGQESRPDISGNTDGRHAWLTALHRGLIVRNMFNHADRTLAIELRYQLDAVNVMVRGTGEVSVTRRGRTVAVSSPDAIQQVQQLLGGSDAVFALRAFLSEREAISDLQAPEMTVLASAAFVASLVGDLDAPRRVATRFVEKHRGIFRPVRFEGCWDKYSKESSDSWSDLQSCMDEANQDDSWLNGAYRRVACNAVWILRSESAWFEYLDCLSPLSISK